MVDRDAHADHMRASSLSRDMGISHEDFLRLLPNALRGLAWRQRGPEILAESSAGRVRITLSIEGQRRLGILSLPVTRVRFDFSGFSPVEQDAFMTTFDRVYQRGGG